jgi:surface protein
MITNLLSFGGKILTVGGNALSISPVDPYNPLNLPPYTIRLKFNNGVTPTFAKGTGVQVSSSPNVWDLTYENTDWDLILDNQDDLLEILGANTTGVTSMGAAFRGCSYLTKTALFDTSAVTWVAEMYGYCQVLENAPLYDLSNAERAEYMYEQCWGLTSIPPYDLSKVRDAGNMFYNCHFVTSFPTFNLSSCTTAWNMFSYCESATSISVLNTSHITNMSGMFSYCKQLTQIPALDTSSATNVNYLLKDCFRVQSGSLALYNQLSTQTNPPSSHSDCFSNCGSYSQTGRDELAQIPTSWGGTMA